jgi:C-terminal processing protease CtpA/Prc
MMDGNIAYVKVGNIGVHDVEKMMDSIIDSKAIIFDIRNYPKGTIVMKKISRSLNTNREVFAKIMIPDLSYPGKYNWKKEKESGTKNKKYYKGKVIILVNGNTQSQSEYFAMSFQKAPNATTIGNQTAGADGNVSRFDLVGGFKTVMTGTGIFYPDGSETQRKGVKIDIEVLPTIEEIKANRDEILEKAIKFANE